jgi:hypothetical protein
MGIVYIEVGNRINLYVIYVKPERQNAAILQGVFLNHWKPPAQKKQNRCIRDDFIIFLGEISIEIL